MKNLWHKIAWAWIPIVFIFIAGCSKDRGSFLPVIHFNVSDEEAMEMFEEAISYSAVGLAFEIEQDVKILQNYLPGNEPYDSCGYLHRYLDTLRNINNVIKAYMSEYYKVNCNSDSLPESLFFNNTKRPNYFDDNSIGIVSTNGLSSFTIYRDSLNPVLLNLTGHYWRNGMYRHREQDVLRKFGYSLRFNFEKAKINANNYIIESANVISSFYASYESCWFCNTHEVRKNVYLTFEPGGIIQVQIGDIFKEIKM